MKFAAFPLYEVFTLQALLMVVGVCLCGKHF